MNCEQFELIQHLNQLQNDINTLISSIQEISLAQAAVLFIRKALTSKDVFSATSEATNIINKFSNGEELPEETNGESDRTVAPVNTAKSGTAHLRRPEDLLYNLSAKILVYTNGIEISQQKMGTKFGMAVPSGDMGGGFDDDGDDDFPADDDMDEWRPPGAPRGGGGAKTARKHTGRGRPPKRKTSTPSQNSKKQRKNSPRRALQRAPQDDMFAVFKQENPDSEWAADDENGFGGFPVQMIKQEQLEFDESQEHDLSESLDMMYDNQDDDDDDEEEGEEVETPCGKGGYPTENLPPDDPLSKYKNLFKDIPFPEMMKYVIAYKRTGAFPSSKLSRNKKNEFRRRSKRFELLDNGDLICTSFPVPRIVVIEREDQLRVLLEAHTSSGEFEVEGQTAGHLGKERTIQNLSSKYYWNGHTKDVRAFIQDCEECRNKKAVVQDLPIQVCTVCGQTRKYKWQMKAHMKYHSTDRPFACHQCPSTFKQQSGLDYHLRVHAGEKSHWCPHCAKGFNGSRQLTDHIRIHTGEKPYLCTICGTSFARNDSLKVHQKQRHHTEPWEHKCTYCEKQFVLKNTLNRHLRTHTGERPFVCPHCARAYSINYKLKQHMKENEIEVPERCNSCTVEFKWKCAFGAHDCRSQLVKKEQSSGANAQSFNQQFEASLGLRGLGGDQSETVVLQLATEEQHEAIARVIVDKTQAYPLNW